MGNNIPQNYAIHRTTLYTVLVHVMQLLILYHLRHHSTATSCQLGSLLVNNHSKQLCICINAAQPADNCEISNMRSFSTDSCQSCLGPLCRLLQLCPLSLNACVCKKVLSKSSFLTGALADSCIAFITLNVNLHCAIGVLQCGCAIRRNSLGVAHESPPCVLPGNMLCQAQCLLFYLHLTFV